MLLVQVHNTVVQIETSEQNVVLQKMLTSSHRAHLQMELTITLTH